LSALQATHKDLVDGLAFKQKGHLLTGGGGLSAAFLGQSHILMS
jgi:hypothetical protein